VVSRPALATIIDAIGRMISFSTAGLVQHI
jgi:Mg/Co/Ni transporter MgtE